MDNVIPVKKNITSANLGRIFKEKVSEVAPVLDDAEEVNVQAKAPKPNLITSLVSGATAGVVVDVTLFPLDTIKTRLQSQQGFTASGGFRGVYKGIVPVLIGSAPTSAIFFGSYNSIINSLKREKRDMSDAWIHFIAASFSETISAMVRVPLELLKQRKQISVGKTTSLDILKQTLTSEGFSGLYRGWVSVQSIFRLFSFSFLSTIVREIPFAAIQFPLWEYFKKRVSAKHQRPVTAFETAYCGAAAGGISAAVTTPMDVLKTRIMLASNETAAKYGRLITFYTARDVYVEKGMLGLFAGIVPRVLWITIGGFVYFGMYEFAKQICEKQTVFPMAQSEENPCTRNYDELRDMEIKRRLMAQSSPTYVDAEDADNRDFNYGVDLDGGGEMDYAESPEFSTKLINTDS